MKQHKWHKEIKACAYGAEIEVYDEVGKQWYLLAHSSPDWEVSNKYRIKPHKHQAIIDAFEQGAVIEAQLITGTWCEVITPDWESNYKFRIKPQSKEPQYLDVYQGIGELVLEKSNTIVSNMKRIGKIKLEE
jgi:hypothetical protein